MYSDADFVFEFRERSSMKGINDFLTYLMGESVLDGFQCLSFCHTFSEAERKKISRF